MASPNGQIQCRSAPARPSGACGIRPRRRPDRLPTRIAHGDVVGVEMPRQRKEPALDPTHPLIEIRRVASNEDDLRHQTRRPVESDGDETKIRRTRSCADPACQLGNRNRRVRIARHPRAFAQIHTRHAAAGRQGADGPAAHAPERSRQHLGLPPAALILTVLGKNGHVEGRAVAVRAAHRSTDDDAANLGAPEPAQDPGHRGTISRAPARDANVTRRDRATRRGQSLLRDPRPVGTAGQNDCRGCEDRRAS